MEPKEVEALFYDWECKQFLRKQNKDLQLLISLAQESEGTVLELGCGSGRVTMHLAEAGIDVIGLDHSGPMLNCLREKLKIATPATAERVQLIEADITDFA